MQSGTYGEVEIGETGHDECGSFNRSQSFLVTFRRGSSVGYVGGEWSVGSVSDVGRDPGAEEMDKVVRISAERTWSGIEIEHRDEG